MKENLKKPDLSPVPTLIPHPTASRIARSQPPVSFSQPSFSLEQDDDEQTSEIFNYLRILRRRKKTILISALAGLVLGLLVAIPMTPVYRAKTSIEVLNLNEDFMNMKQASPTTTNIDSDTSEEQTQAKLLESNALKQRVIAKLSPKSPGDASTRSDSSHDSLQSWLHLPNHGPTNVSNRLSLEKTAATLKIRPAGRTRVLELTVDSTSPTLAANFANTLVQEFIEMNMEERYEATHKTSEWLRREIDDARIKLQASEDALQKYARESGLIFTDENTNVATEKLQQVQQQLLVATADRIAKESRYNLSRNSPAESLPEVLGDKNLQEESAKVNELKRQVASLSAIFNPGYDKLQQAQAELAEAKSLFEHDKSEVLKRIENEYQQSLGSEKMLSDAYNSQTHEVTGQSEKAIQYNILKREVDSNRQLYDTMLQQTKQASVASAMRSSNVRVVDPATNPTSPVSPDPKINSAAGLLAGLLLSIAGIILQERADRTIQQPSEAKLWTGLPELGVIPSTNAKLAGGYYAPAKLSAAKGMRLAGPTQSIELITWNQKPSFVSEAFRSTLASIFFVGDAANRPHVLVFTSAGPGDGKTTVVSNLAIATAEIRYKVLVIDADMRRPRMHNIFGVPNTRGLSDILSEQLESETLANFIQETNIPGLHVLVAGPPTQSAGHLLYSANLAECLTELREQYDMIFIDTPPALQLTDARIAGRLADAVVLVARAKMTTRDALIALKDRFAEDGIPVLGTVLNDWDPSKSSNGYYGNYGSRYHGGRYEFDQGDDKSPSSHLA